MGIREGFLLQWADKLLTGAMNGRAVQVLTSSCHGWVGTNSYNLRICHRPASFSIANTSAIQDPTVFQPLSVSQPDVSFLLPTMSSSSTEFPPRGTSQSFRVVQSGPQVWSPDQQHQHYNADANANIWELLLQRKTLESNPSPGFKFQLLKNTY